ncbi:MAG: hypothetical protein JST19_05255 [Bacteroidetes bacterium]|nr:hypothetical protein [Bacteroidota bacterium]
MKKYLLTRVRVLLLLTVYLLFHVINSFFTLKHNIGDEAHILLKQGTSCVIQLQKSAKTIVSENRQSFKRYMQKASSYFILLLLFTASATIAYSLSSAKPRLPAAHPHLRFCVLRI